MCSLGRTLLAFALLHFVLHGQICLLLQVFLDFLLVMLKILQARHQQYMNRELPDVQVGFRKGRGTSCQHLLDHGKSKRVPEKHLFLLC